MIVHGIMFDFFFFQLLLICLTPSVEKGFEPFCDNTCFHSLFDSGPPRFDGDRPRFGDREGYRSGPRGPAGEFGGEKGGAPADYQPSFSVSILSV